MSPWLQKHPTTSVEIFSSTTMQFLCVSLCVLLILFIQSVSSQGPTTKENAIYPPRGWNSYDAFSWTIVEREFLDNAAELSSLLLDHGYEIATVDSYWHRGLDNVEHIDDWGRVIPDPNRWPSSVNGVGFRDVADQVHRLGLKFGIQVLGGINKLAVDQNKPILDVPSGKPYKEGGREWHAKDIIVDANSFCPYAPSSFYINTQLGAGKAFLRSVFDLFSSWGVDFVKLDCVFGENYNLNTITAVSEILKNLDNPIILSVSSGVKASLEMGKEVSGLVNMFRVNENTWDQWSHVLSHFDTARDFTWAGLSGAEGLRGNSWFDLDALPFGRLTDQDGKQGPHRNSNLTPAEQRTQITLWTMARSPLIFGGDLRNLDLEILNMLIHPTLEDIHFFSSQNKEIDPKLGDGFRAWIATGRNGEVYVAIFNVSDQTKSFEMPTSYLGTIIPEKKFSFCKGKEVWQQIKDLPEDKIGASLGAHDCALFALNCS